MADWLGIQGKFKDANKSALLEWHSRLWPAVAAPKLLPSLGDHTSKAPVEERFFFENTFPTAWLTCSLAFAITASRRSDKSRRAACQAVCELALLCCRTKRFKIRFRNPNFRAMATLTLDKLGQLPLLLLVDEISDEFRDVWLFMRDAGRLQSMRSLYVRACKLAELSFQHVHVYSA